MPTDAVIGLLWETTRKTRLPQYSIGVIVLHCSPFAERSAVRRSLHAVYAHER